MIKFGREVFHPAGVHAEGIMPGTERSWQEEGTLTYAVLKFHLSLEHGFIRGINELCICNVADADGLVKGAVNRVYLKPKRFSREVERLVNVCVNFLLQRFLPVTVKFPDKGVSRNGLRSCVELTRCDDDKKSDDYLHALDPHSQKSGLVVWPPKDLQSAHGFIDVYIYPDSPPVGAYTASSISTSGCSRGTSINNTVSWLHPTSRKNRPDRC